MFVLQSNQVHNLGSFIQQLLIQVGQMGLIVTIATAIHHQIQII